MNVQVQAKVVDAGHIVKVNSDGSLSVYNRYYENGKEKIARFPNEYMTAKHNYQLEKNAFRGTSTINAPVVSARTGAMSAGTVTATITDQHGKRQVMGQVYEKAKIGGKALGKGAATVGRAAASRTPYGIAFMLALEALGGSKFFWDDEKGDFVKEKEEQTFIVFVQHGNTLNAPPNPLDKRKYDDYCGSEGYDGNKINCQFLGYTKSAEAGWDKALQYCKTVQFSDYSGTFQGDSIAYSTCATQGGFWTSDKRVNVVEWFDYTPITLDEFIEEATPSAAQKPNEWVETSEVKPTDDTKFDVPAGTVAQSDPYTDPKDKKVKQTRWDFDTGGRVRETEIERPDLTPDSTEAPELKPPPEEVPTDKDGDKEKDKDSDKDSDKDKDAEKDKPESASQPHFDLCKEHPEILACQQMGEVKEEDGFFDDIKIPQVTDSKTWEEDRFLPSNGTCPAPKVFHVWGKPFQVSYEPLCSLMQQVRFIILVAFIVMSAYLVFGSLFRKD